jgi:hypothetical protein
MIPGLAHHNERSSSTHQQQQRGRNGEIMAAARPLTHASFVVMKGKVCVAYKNFKGIYKMIEKHGRRFILESNSLPQATR